MLRQGLRFLQRQQQRHQLARAHLAQGHAGGDALHVGAALELRPQRLPQVGVGARVQRVDGLQALPRLRAIALGLQQPALQGTAAHAGHAGVQQREQGGGVLATQRLHQLQIAPRGGGQVDQRIVALHLHAADVRELAALRVFGISQERGGGGVGQRQVLRVPA